MTSYMLAAIALTLIAGVIAAVVLGPVTYAIATMVVAAHANRVHRKAGR